MPTGAGILNKRDGAPNGCPNGFSGAILTYLSRKFVDCVYKQSYYCFVFHILNPILFNYSLWQDLLDVLSDYTAIPLFRIVPLVIVNFAVKLFYFLKSIVNMNNVFLAPLVTCEDSCSADGLCDQVPVDATASLVQVPFDCQLLRCSDGREVVVPDDSDVPTNPCVDASCSGGELSETVKPDGTLCELGQGTGSCQGGECVVECGDDPTVCDDDNPCTVDSCNVAAKVCEHEKLDNEPTPNQVDGDCLLQLCSAGQLQQVADDNDLPVDGNPCTDDLCNMGVPNNPPVVADTPCGNDAFCDGNGNCIGCDQPSDCDGQDTVCRWRTCENQVCGVAYAPQGTVVQPLGPCQQQQCDGQGNEETATVPNGTGCDDGTYCNGTDTCLGGNCSNHAGNPCSGPDNDADCAESCDEGGGNCSAADPQGSPCNSGAGLCDNAGNCVVCFDDPLPTGDPNNCPTNPCTGGCSQDGICTIDCTGTQACKSITINCPVGFDCLVDCSASDQGCQDLILNCPADFTCAIDCSGNGNQSCQNAHFHCSQTGMCGLDCSGGQMCQGTWLHCGADACTAVCTGNGDTPSLDSCQSSCSCSSC